MVKTRSEKASEVESTSLPPMFDSPLMCTEKILATDRATDGGYVEPARQKPASDDGSSSLSPFSDSPSMCARKSLMETDGGYVGYVGYGYVEHARQKPASDDGSSSLSPFSDSPSMCAGKSLATDRSTDGGYVEPARQKAASDDGSTSLPSFSDSPLIRPEKSLGSTLDQLAEFLGHDIQIHRKFYRLPEGTLQLAKISKVLMAPEQRRIAEFKGKNLEQISLEPYVDMGSDVSSEEESEPEPNRSQTDESYHSHKSAKRGKRVHRKKAGTPALPASQEVDSPLEACIPAKEGSTKSVDIGSDVSSEEESEPEPKRSRTDESYRSHKSAKRGKSVHRGKAGTPALPASQGASTPRRKWSQEEVEAVEKTLSHCIASGTVPGRKQCEDCVRSAPVVLQRRTWEAVKFYVKKRITAYQRESERRKESN